MEFDEQPLIKYTKRGKQSYVRGLQFVASDQACGILVCSLKRKTPAGMGDACCLPHKPNQIGMQYTYLKFAVQCWCHEVA